MCSKPLLVAVLLSVLTTVRSGRWVYLTADYNYKDGYNHGVGVIDRKFMRGEVKACYGMEVLFMEDDNWSNYAYYQLYYYSSYTAMLDGGSYMTWDYGNILDCYNWKPFWFMWDGNTQSMGMGLEPGTDVYLTSNFGRTFPIRLVKFATADSGLTGEWRILYDDPPLFESPWDAGNEIIYISETTSQYTVVHTVTVDEPDGDTITYSGSDDSGSFELYGASLYSMVSLDYETKSQYFVTMEISDGTYTRKNGLTIIITDAIDETPWVTAHGISIPEELAVGTDVGQIATWGDGDAGDTFYQYWEGSTSYYLTYDFDTLRSTVKSRMDVDSGRISNTNNYVMIMDSVYNYDYKYMSYTIYDVNDHVPYFNSEYYEASIADGTSSNVKCVTVGAYDGDIDNGGLTTSLVSQNGATSGFSFTLYNNYDVYTSSTIDYDALESVNFEYVLVLSVVDQPYAGDPALTSTTVVKIKVTPANDNTPSWTGSGSWSASIAEDAPLTTLLTTIAATDADKGPDGEIVYSITGVSPTSGSDLFTVDSYSGQVRVGGQLDHDGATGGVSSYTLSVRATDKGSSPKYRDGTVTVTITGVNDNAPTFSSSVVTASLSEDSGLNVDLATITANDNDGDSISFSIESGGDGFFSMSGGKVRYTSSAVDYETKQVHILLIKATDGVHNAYIAAEITVVDVIDEPPVITVISSSSMAEEQAVGSAVFGGYHVTDPDAGDTLTYAISGADAPFVNIDSSTGELTVAKNIDYDSGKTSLSLTLTVTDQAGLTATQAFSITVEDINDNAPLFSPAIYDVDIEENTGAGLSITSLTASDLDTGSNGQYDVTIDSGDLGLGTFSMSGKTLITTSTATDYEALAGDNFMFTLTIKATDKPSQGDSNSGYAIVHVRITPKNEHAPAWSGSMAGKTISEDSPLGHVVDTYVAMDDDHGADGEVTYSITSIIAASGASTPDMFTMGETSGVLTVGGVLDVDTGTSGESSYTVNMRATDGGASPRHSDTSVVVTLTNVNDNPPFYDQDKYEASLDEDAAIGTAMTLVPDDYDGDALTLSIVSGDTALFKISGNDVQVKSALDYEADTFHVLVVRANDGLHDTDVALHVTVNDVIDEQPIIAMVGSGSVSEEQAIGTGVYGGYLVTDPDVSDTLTYAIGGTDSAYVSIDSGTGELSIAQNVDREAGKTQLDLTLTVTDLAGLTATQTFSIAVEDINDKAPVFNPSEFTAQLTENAASDVSLLDLTCADGDLGDNAQFDVTVASGDGGAGVFKMAGLQLLTTSSPADYEALESEGFMYTLIITAVDKPQHGAANTGTAIVRVSVKPENEFTPVWTAPSHDGSRNFNGATVSEGDPPGTVIATFQATDDDLGDDGLITYSLVTATASSGVVDNDKFSVDASTGELRVAGKLDVDVGTNGVGSYTVVVRASDNGATANSVDGTIVVSLTNINDNAPYFDQSDYVATISEAEPVGTAVITLNTDDFDGDTVTLSVVSGPTDLFECDGNHVKVKAGLDYETSTFHVLIIRASDGVFDTEVPLQVNVDDVIDEVPVITVVNGASMSEEQAVGSAVYGGYAVTDADAGDTLTYTLSGADSGFLSIDSATGELSVAQNVNREGSSPVTSLSLTLTVTDLAGLKATKDFTITVKDINDLPPVLNPIEYSAEIIENAASGLSLVDLVASDGDEGLNSQFSFNIVSGDGGAGLFQMSGAQLQTSGTGIDYESLQASGYTYILVITAVDTPDFGSARTGTAIVKVSVKAANEHAPGWTLPDSTGSFTAGPLAEDSALGHVVTTFQASDADHGEDGFVTYSIVSVTGDDTGASAMTKFVIGKETGELMVAEYLDYDLTTSGDHSYTIVVRVTDTGATPKTVDGTVVVSLSNVNDNPPVFPQSDYDTSIDESSVVDDVVISFTVTDDDGDSITMAVVTGRDDLFDFDGMDLKLKGTLDYESETSYVLFISASDGTHTTISTLQININDVIDETPVISMVSSPSMAEGQTIGTGVYGGYDVTDADAGDTLTYVLSGSDSSYLSIGANTGELMVAQNVDREEPKTSLSLTLTVTDQAGLTATQDFTITVEDINDMTPTFDPSQYQVEVTEGTAADTSLLDLSVSDGDNGDNAVFDVSILSGDDASTKFKISGQQLLTNSASIDYESLEASSYKYTLVIVAVDTPSQGSANTGTALVTVFVKPVNDFSPVWSSPAVDGSGNFPGISADEDILPGSVLTTVLATDDDLGDDGVVVYSIVSVTGASAASADNKFIIDPARGNISVNEYLDVDTATGGETSYTIVIRAADKAASPNAVEASVVVTLVNVNDNAPSFDQTEYKADASEDTAVGTAILTFTTEDFDLDTVTLTIESGPADLFEIDGSDLKVKAALDYESDQFHVLIVRATDGVFNTDVPVHIDILDIIDEPPVITMVTTSLMADDQAIGTAAYGGYSISDPDEGDTHTYALSGTDSGYFTIDQDTGDLTVAQLIDREAGVTSLSLTLTVTDLAGLQATQDFTITVEDINDQTPIFDKSIYEIEVAENTAADTSILLVTVTDKDLSNTASTSVSVFSGDDNLAKFKMSGKELHTSATALDYDVLQASGFVYTLVLIAEDIPSQGDPNSATAVVKVKVTPVNEHSPVWTLPDASGSFSSVTINEDSNAGHVVTTFEAEDDDLGNDGLVTYSIVSVTGASGAAASGSFSIGEHTGELMVSAPLDFDTDTGGEGSFTVVVRASDGGATPNTVDGTITINLDNVNDNAPYLDQGEYQVDVPEDTTAGTSIISLGTGDHDGDTVTLSILSGDTDLFEIDGNDVKLKASIDFETSSFHVLIIKASDGQFESEVSLQVDVQDLIDETPVITMVTTSSVAEEQTLGSAVYGGYAVTDADADDTLTFALSGTDSSLLTIDSSTGHLAVAQNFDRDAGQTQLSLTLTVTDQAGLQATQDFTITVEDINDQTPEFSPYIYEVSVAENTVAGTSLVDFTISDSDNGNNAIYGLSIDSGDDDGSTKFKLSGEQLQTDNTIDYDILESSCYTYTLIVLATDTPDQGNPRTGVAVVKVTVTPENEFTPVWTSPDSSGSFSTSVDEDAEVGDVVLSAQASDDDAGADGTVIYNIMSVNGDTTGSDLTGLFVIDSSSGDVRVSGQLDRDHSTGGESSYTLVIRASDNSTSSPLTVDGSITISLSGVNDNAPTFGQGQYEANIDEDKAVGSVVTTLDTEDHDDDAVTLSIHSGRSDLFEISGNDVLVKTSLDFETGSHHVLLVNVTDGLYMSTVSLHITVNDVIDEAPTITPLTGSIMTEGQTIGTGLHSGFIFSDGDAGDELTFSITGGDSSLLNIDSSTGLITVADHVDREGTNGLTELPDMTLTVTDKGGNQATQTFKITVDDLNDLPPIFEPDVYEVEVDENTALGTLLLHLTCSDGDSGQNAVLQTTVVSGDDASNKFTMTGTDLYSDANLIDYEALETAGYSYTLLVHSVDTPDQGDQRTGTAVVEVKVRPVNEFDPVWTDPANDGSGSFTGVNVNEDVELGHVVTTFTATDDDHGVDGDVTYSIVSVTGDSDGTSLPDLLTIDSTTGELLVSSRLDSDTATGGQVSYTVVVEASDNGATPRTTQGTIVINPDNVNDNAPTFLDTEYQVAVDEDVAVGDVVITMGTEDHDGDAQTLSISSGNDAGLFEIDGNDVKVKAALDYETSVYHVLVVKSNDGVFDSYVSLEITINDVIDEAPVITMTTTGTMSEGQTVGTAVNGGYTVTDPDVTDLLTYALSGADSAYLKINSSSGVLTVDKDVDREGADPKTSLSLTLTITDQAGLQATQVFTITVEDINDQVPKCDPAVFTTEVTENSAGDLAILDLTCSDGDAGDNAQFDVFIDSGDNTDNRFKMSGLQLLTSHNPIDYESLRDSDFVYTLIITAVDKPTDGNARTGTAIVRVTVLPENEFDPIWVDPVPDASGYLNDVTVDEDSPPGTPITTLSAEDDDMADDGRVTYEITSIKLDDGTDAADTFVIGTHTGDLQVKSELDAEGNIAYYDISLRALDGGSPAKEVSGAIKVYVNNVNDLPPEFSSNKYFVQVAEDTSVGASIFQLDATDPDHDSLTFSVDGEGSDMFTCVGDELTLLQGLDFETNRYHSIVVSADDGIHKVYVSVIVKVENVIDEAPVISLTTPIVVEEQPVGTVIGNIFTVTDADDGDEFTFSLSGDNAHLFAINETSGELSVSGRIDNDLGSHTLDKVTLTVTDQGGQSSSKDVTFDIRDINDNPPIFSRESYNGEVTESSAASVSILDFTVSDADVGSNAQFFLRVGEGDDTTPKFSFTGSTLYADARQIDYEAMADVDYKYTLTVEAVDTPDEDRPMTGIATVVVMVLPANEFSPQWSSPVLDGSGHFPTVTIAENTPFGSSLGNYTATDGDEADDGKVTYAVVSATDSNGNEVTDKFDMTTEDGRGQLVTSSELDADAGTGGSPSYELVIKAVDQGVPERSVTATVTVEVTDENDPLPTIGVDNTTEKWILRGAVVGAAAALALTSVLVAKAVSANAKTSGSVMPNRFERPQSVDRSYTYADLVRLGGTPD